MSKVAKILITDDSTFMCDMLKDIIVEAGHEVVMASTGVELLETYTEIKPDVVMLDIIMPGINGLETLEQLLKKHPEAKVVMCSATLGQEKIVKQALDIGAVTCIAKPFSAVEIIGAINMCIGQ